MQLSQTAVQVTKKLANLNDEFIVGKNGIFTINGETIISGNDLRSIAKAKSILNELLLAQVIEHYDGVLYRVSGIGYDIADSQ